jgi:NAD-dependent dihydropyrimidine dehydrogenase PreA subunit
MGELTRQLAEALAPFAPVKWGACKIDPALPLPEPFENALVVVIPYPEMTTLETYTEPGFRAVSWGVFPQARAIMGAAISVLVRNKIRWGAAPNTEEAEEFETNMTEVLSSKEAARRAGLGWIGKSNLLVTKEFGPRVVPMTLLCDGDLDVGAPVEKSLCGTCRACTENCAYNAIYGKIWEPGVTREEQVDYAKCSEGRLAGYLKIGRKFNCALCIAACPYGTKPAAGAR